jgi:phospholipid/cholesterol/gamma-HCH transport system substrate-binding protein
MEREANYAAVGTFVLLLVAMAGAFVYWYSDTRDTRNFTRYEIYFDGSVSGLSEGGAVRYLGVDIGRVRRIRLDQRAADRVLVIVDIDSTTPISERTVAQLSLLGVTGLLFIDLQQQTSGKTALKVIEPVPSLEYPVIRSARSNFDTFVSSLPDVTARLGELVVRANTLLSDRNIATFSQLIGDVGRAGAALPEAVASASELMRDLRTATADTRTVLAEVQTAVRSAGPDLATGMERLRVTSENMARASQNLDAMITENRAELRSFTRDGLPQVEALARDSRAAAREFRELWRSLRDNPSQLLYQPAPRGVEIPR